MISSKREEIFTVLNQDGEKMIEENVDQSVLSKKSKAMKSGAKSKTRYPSRIKINSRFGIKFYYSKTIRKNRN